MDLQTRRRSLSVAILAALLALYGCGGGGGGGSAPVVVNPPVAPTLSGVFSDDPVAGLSYTTSGGYSGMTDANGNFKFNTGETVTFKIGNLALGTTKGGNTITPTELTTSANQATNIYVLLQSLDNKSVANTITIPSALASANLSSIDLTQASAVFASTANAALVAAQTTAGITSGIVSPSAAIAHANAQFQKQAVGVWQLYQSGTAQPVVFRFDASGAYLMGAADGTRPKIEAGTMSVDPLNGHFSGKVTLDTNGESGLSNPSPTELTQTMKFDGPNLAIRDSSGVLLFQFQRVANNNSSMVGAWALTSATTLATQDFIFFPDGKFMMIDPIGDTGASHCGAAGVEYGTYTFAAATGLTVSGISVDTNGCAGMNDTTRLPGSMFQGLSSIPAALSSDGNTLNLPDGLVIKRL